MRKYILPKLLLLIFALSACAPSTTEILDRLSETPGKIGVYSVVPDVFRNTIIGTTVFNNRRTERSAAQWNFNGVAEKVLSSQFEQQGVPSVILRSRPRPIAQNSTSAIFMGHHAPILGRVFDEARQAGLARIAVVQPNYYQDGPADYEAPFGIHQFRAFGQIGTAEQYIRLEIQIYDVATRSPSDSIVLFDGMPIEIAVETDASLYTRDQFVGFERAIKGLLRKSISNNVKR